MQQESGQNGLNAMQAKSKKINHLLNLLMAGDNEPDQHHQPPPGPRFGLQAGVQAGAEATNADNEKKRKVQFNSTEDSKKGKRSHPHRLPKGNRYPSEGAESSEGLPMYNREPVSEAASSNIGAAGSYSDDNAVSTIIDGAHVHSDRATDGINDPLHLDEEDHEWFRTLFRSTITPREQGGDRGFTEPLPATAHATAVTSYCAFDDNFGGFPYSPASPMFHHSSRLTPSRNRTSNFFSPDMDISTSPRRYPPYGAASLNRDFMFGDGDIPLYESKLQELTLPANRIVSRSCTKENSVSNEGITSSAAEGITTSQYDNINTSNFTENNAVTRSEHDNVPIEEDCPVLATEEVVAAVLLPSIPANLLVVHAHDDVHIKLDPILPMHNLPEVVMNPLQNGANSILPKIPQSYLDAPTASMLYDLSVTSSAVPSYAAVVTDTEVIESATARDAAVAPTALLNAESESLTGTTASGIVDISGSDAKPKRKTIDAVVKKVIDLLDITILRDYQQGDSLDILSARIENDRLANTVARSSNEDKNHQSSLLRAMKTDAVRKRLTKNDVQAIAAGNMHATNLAKVLGEAHHRRVWEITAMLEVLGLLEQIPGDIFFRRCIDDSQMILTLALLQADFFEMRSSLVFKLQNAVMPCSKPIAAPIGVEFDHAYYYKEVIKIFLCGHKVSVPDIRQIFAARGCMLSQSGERRLYDAVAVMTSSGLIRRFDDPNVYIASVSKKVFQWSFYDLLVIREYWLKAVTKY